MTAKLYDTVVVREQRERLKKSNKASDNGLRAADALLWWDGFGHGRTPQQQLTAELALISGPDVPGRASMQHYLDQAMLEAIPSIVKRAVELARSELDYSHTQSVPKNHPEGPTR